MDILVIIITHVCFVLSLMTGFVWMCFVLVLHRCSADGDRSVWSLLQCREHASVSVTVQVVSEFGFFQR